MRKRQKKLILGLTLAYLAQIWAPKNFLRGFYLYLMLNIATSDNCMQFQGDHMIQTQENGEKPRFGLDLCP